MAARRDLPPAALAEVHTLVVGYVDGVGGRLAATVTYIRDDDVRVIVDPGMLASVEALLAPLAALGETAEGVTDVIVTRPNPGHMLSAALFPHARSHDARAVYQGDIWKRGPAESILISPSIRLIVTPGHTAHDLTALIGTPDGMIACTHLWSDARGPDGDPLTADLVALRASRQRVLAIVSLIIPAHGAPFIPGPRTPR